MNKNDLIIFMKDDISYDKKKRQNLLNKNFPIQLLKIKKYIYLNRIKKQKKKKRKNREILV